MLYLCVQVTGHSYCPEVVHNNVEHAENHHQHNRAPLRLESDRDHHTCHGTDRDHNHASKGPLSSENEANEQEDEENSASQLEVHLAVLLIELWKTGRRELFADPAVGENHDQSSHDRKVAQEEVDVEDESVTQCLRDHDSDQTTDCVLAVFTDDDKNAAAGHGDHVDEKEDVVDTPWHYREQNR